MRTIMDIYGNEAGLVDKFIGTAFDTVKVVADNIETIVAIGESIDVVLNVGENLEQLQSFTADVEAATATWTTMVQTSTTDFNALVASKQDIFDDEVTAAQAAQTAAETAATTATTQASTASTQAGTATSKAAEAAASATLAQGYASEAMSSAGLLDFASLLTLTANATLTYSAGANQVTAGMFIRTRAEGLVYEVAASGASDHHVTTAGGVKLYEAGRVYSSLARFQQAFARIPTLFRTNEIVLAEGLAYLRDGGTGLAGLTGWSYAPLDKVADGRLDTLEATVAGHGTTLTALDAQADATEVLTKRHRRNLPMMVASDLGALHNLTLALPFFETSGSVKSTVFHMKMSRAGRIVGGFMAINQTRQFGSVELKAMVNNVATVIGDGTIKIDGDNPTDITKEFSWEAGTPFAAGVSLGLQAQSTIGWGSTGNTDVMAHLIVEFEPLA